MKASFLILSKDWRNRIIEERYHGIGEVDCEFKNFFDVVEYYSKKIGKSPIQTHNTAFMFEDTEGWIYLQLEDIFKFRIGHIVRSNNNNCPIRFEKGEIISAFLTEDFKPCYKVSLQDGTTRDFIECELIQVLD